MKPDQTPVLDPRDATALMAELLRRRAAYLPEWQPRPGEPADALLRICARYAEVVLERLNGAPERNRLAFLDMLGASLLPAQPARAPVVFQPLPRAGDSRVEAGARLGAEAPGRPAPIRFETESAIALAGARLTDVVSLWPDRDAAAVHSAAAAGGQPFTLWERLAPVAHALYLAHDTLFALKGGATVELRFELAPAGSAPLDLAWEFWDGQTWRAFAEFGPAADASLDGTAGLTRSGTVTLRVACGEAAPTKVGGIEARWVRARLTQPLPPDPARVLPAVDRIWARAVVRRPLPKWDPNKVAGDLKPDAAFADGAEVDTSSVFQPLGLNPRPGSAFYLACEEVFSKPGALVSLRFWVEGTTQALKPDVVWQYWDGHEWATLVDAPGEAGKFVGEGDLKFTVPADLAPRAVQGQEGRWIRARLVNGGYGTVLTIGWPPDAPVAGNELKVVQPAPPALTAVRLGYTWYPAWEPPRHCLAENDSQWEVRSRDVRWSGGFFPPFRPVADRTPALYLGFDRPLPNDRVSLYLDLEESGRAHPPLVWEAWNGEEWRAVTVADETAHLARPGMVSFIPPAVGERPVAAVRAAAGAEVQVAGALEAARFRPGDRVVLRLGDDAETAQVEGVDEACLRLAAPLTRGYAGGTVQLAALPRFGEPRDWVRARRKENGAPPPVAVRGIYLNATWALQVETLRDEVLGSATGQPGQTVFFRQFPVLPGEEIEVRELEGPRAAVELPLLREELRRQGLGEEALRVVTEPRTGRATEVWVRWRAVPHFGFSGPTDRHYVIERARGRLLLPDGRNGRLAAVGANNLRARVYQSGGELAGNVAAGSIRQPLAGVPPVQGVTNPRAAQGGADGETLAGVGRRGPETLRHRWRSLAAGDWEALAREASPGVAAVRVLPATAANGRPAPGWVTIVIVPQSEEAQPQPSGELRRQVHDYLAARAPATLSGGRIAVIGPTYLPVGVTAVVAPRDPGQAGPVRARILQALARFLHPLTGGPDGDGWPAGRDVFLSDLAALLEGVAGVDYVKQLDLLLDGAPVGPQVAVPPDRIVVAGPLRVELEATEQQER